MTVFDIAIDALTGGPAELDRYRGRALVIVNVASRCGLTPQYAGLERLHRRYAPRGLTVIGVPCNQFMEQEPGTPEEIAAFCSSSYGVTFPMTEKIDVNGETRHALYRELVGAPDDEGHSGDIRWNFEKFVVAPDGAVTARFAPPTDPEDDRVIAAIEAVLPG